VHAVALRQTAGLPRLAFGSRPLGKRLAALPAARETLGAIRPILAFEVIMASPPRDPQEPGDGSQPARTETLLASALLIISILMISTSAYQHWGGTPEADPSHYVRKFNRGLEFLFAGGGTWLVYLQRRKRPWMFIGTAVCLAVLLFTLLFRGE